MLYKSYVNFLLNMLIIWLHSIRYFIINEEKPNKTNFLQLELAFQLSLKHIEQKVCEKQKIYQLLDHLEQANWSISQNHHHQAWEG